MQPFVIHDIETLWQAEKGLVWKQLVNSLPPYKEISVHVFCPSAGTFRLVCLHPFPTFSQNPWVFVKMQIGSHTMCLSAHALHHAVG